MSTSQNPGLPYQQQLLRRLLLISFALLALALLRCERSGTETSLADEHISGHGLSAPSTSSVVKDADAP